MNSIKYLNKTAFIAVLFFVVSGFAQVDKKKNDWGKENLKGKVKSFTCHTYKVIKKGRKIKKGERGDGYSDNFHLIFNNSGNKIEHIKYDERLKIKSTANYDEKGNLTLSSNTDFYYKHTSKYDKKGNRTDKMYSYGTDLKEIMGKNIYKYSKKGNKIRCSKYNSDGSLRTKFIYRYDKKGNEIEMNEYKPDRSLENKYTYKYDTRGNKIEMNTYKSDRGLKAKYTYKYNKNGDRIETNTYKGDGSLNEKYIYKYKYDKEGNWINQIEFKNNIPQKIRERTFEYFE